MTTNAAPSLLIFILLWWVLLRMVEHERRRCQLFGFRRFPQPKWICREHHATRSSQDCLRKCDKVAATERGTSVIRFYSLHQFTPTFAKRSPQYKRINKYQRGISHVPCAVPCHFLILAGSHSPLRRWLAFRFCEVIGWELADAKPLSFTGGLGGLVTG